MTYTIVYQKHVVKDEIPKLPASAKEQIRKAIGEKLTLDPIGFGKPLRYTLKGYRRLRIGDYRVVYRIERLTVTIVTIQHRKDVYDKYKLH